MSTRALLLAAVALALVAGGCGSTTSETPLTGADFVLAPEKVHYGGSYADWSVLWWQWDIEHTAAHHPLFDATGADAAEGQVDPVWFIGGTIGSLFGSTVGITERTITLPAGVALFFPLLNGEWDNDYCTGPGWVPRTAAELAQLAFEALSASTDIYCEIDGVRVIDSPDIYGNAGRFRAISGTFSALLPVDNIATALCGDPPGPKLVSPAVSDGIWMMIAPMPAGEHTIKWGGKFPVFGGTFEQIITYHITVTP